MYKRQVQGIRPDLILGDFDSISGALPGDIEIKRFKPEKDFTDLELAIKTAVESEFTELEIIEMCIRDSPTEAATTQQDAAPADHEYHIRPELASDSWLKDAFIKK